MVYILSLAANDPNGTDARRSKRPLLIAALGTPHAPAWGEAFVARLAREVGRLQPDREVAAATLADGGSLSSVARALEHPIVFPHFVDDGSAVSIQLPSQLGAAGLEEWVTTVPFGLLQDLRPRAVHALKAAMLKHALPTSETTLIIAVDCDPSDARRAHAADTFARAMAPSRLFKKVHVAFLRGPHFLSGDHGPLGHVMVLPFMAEKRPGVQEEIIRALAVYGAIGPILAPIGMWPSVPALISHAVRAHAMNAAI